jgi:hypothetical protein
MYGCFLWIWRDGFNFYQATTLIMSFVRGKSIWVTIILEMSQWQVFASSSYHSWDCLYVSTFVRCLSLYLKTLVFFVSPCWFHRCHHFPRIYPAAGSRYQFRWLLGRLHRKFNSEQSEQYFPQYKEQKSKRAVVAKYLYCRWNISHQSWIHRNPVDDLILFIYLTHWCIIQRFVYCTHLSDLDFEIGVYKCNDA